MTVAEVAGLLRVRPATIRSLAHQGHLAYFRIGQKAMRFRPEDVEAYASRRHFPARVERRQRTA